MTACGPTLPIAQPVPEVHNIYPRIPPDDLVCMTEPAPGQILTDVQAAQWAESVRVAGSDCRAKIGTLRGIVNSWPK